MTKVISVKFKGGGKSYFFSPCAQEVERGMGVIVETSKGLEYAIVTEGVHEVEDEAIVPPLMPTVRIATQKDMEQLEKNEARKGEAMKIVKEKIEARGLDMKPVDCEFSFDGSKVTVYFTSENRVDFRELIKDLSAAFRMRIELRQIGIREEIKLMGGLAPCGRECCCVRSLQEPKKVSVKMAKNQGLSLNPSKISGLCGRLMCCLSYENDYYAEVCKRVPKIGSEATTPDGKGTVVNVNMLKMIVKVKIEQGDSVTYKDFPLDKISFMRGSEVIGSVGGDEEEEAEDESLKALEEEADERDNSGSPENKNGERKQGDSRHGKHNGERQNRKNGEKQSGEKQSGEKQSGEQGKEPNPNQGGKNRNKKRNRHGGDGAKEGNSAGEGKQNQGGQGGKRSNQGGKGQNGQSANAQNANAQNGNSQNANSQNGNKQGANNQGQGNSGRNRKKHRPNKNGGAKSGANGAGGDGQKDNA